MNGNTRWRRFAAWALAVGAGLAVSSAVGGRPLHLNTWNEYTEGSYLMPDTRHGDAFLKALKKAVAPDGAGTRE